MLDKLVECRLRTRSGRVYQRIGFAVTFAGSAACQRARVSDLRPGIDRHGRPRVIPPVVTDSFSSLGERNSTRRMAELPLAGSVLCLICDNCAYRGEAGYLNRNR